ncbi:MAG: DUF2203 domain-containing protein [Planctomycetota bacterium]
METIEYQPRKLFTVEEANRMLPLVRRIVADITSTYQKLVAKHERFRDLAPNGSVGVDSPQWDKLADMRDELEADQESLLAFAKELSDLGVELKGEADGLVDFPALRDGRVVYLCWKQGEPNVGHWHEIADGFRGRQPIDHSEAVPTISLPKE